jgi:hypothetical protein
VEGAALNKSPACKAKDAREGGGDVTVRGGERHLQLRGDTASEQNLEDIQYSNRQILGRRK